MKVVSTRICSWLMYSAGLERLDRMCARTRITSIGVDGDASYSCKEVVGFFCLSLLSFSSLTSTTDARVLQERDGDRCHLHLQVPTTHVDKQNSNLHQGKWSLKHLSQNYHNRNHQISAIKKLASYIRTTVGVNLLYRGYGLDPALEALLQFQDIPACEPIFDMSTFTE